MEGGETSGNLCEQLGSHADSWGREPRSANVSFQAGSPDLGQATGGLFLQVLSSSCNAAEQFDKDQWKLRMLCSSHEALITCGTHFVASVSLCLKETTSWNKTSTAVLPHRIKHFSSITALDWGSCVFFSLLSLEHYRPLGKSPSQKQRSLATQKGREVAKKSQAATVLEREKVFMKVLN